MDSDLERFRKRLAYRLNGTGVRIRRYSLDPRLRLPDPPPDPADAAAMRRQEARNLLREQADLAWKEWATVREAFVALGPSCVAADLADIEQRWLAVDRKVDLLQRELIADDSFAAGARTVVWLALVTIGLFVLYLATHRVHSSDLTRFDSWPEWGPMKYGEVAFWSTFGTCCALLYFSSSYLMRRDFDRWFQPWYVTTLIRSPFLSVLLMVVVLEFVEWWGVGQDNWIETYLLEEGNKFYFIAFVSFCLGLTTDATNRTIRQLTGGVGVLVQNIVGRLSRKLGTAVTNADAADR